MSKCDHESKTKLDRHYSQCDGCGKLFYRS